MFSSVRCWAEPGLQQKFSSDAHSRENTDPCHPPRLVRVWDLPPRVHWLLAAAVAGLFVTGWIAGPAIVWHSRLGYLVAALLLFRIAWGFVGGHWSRFTNFLYSPAAVWRYLRGRQAASDDIGHSPLGALSVFAMLAMLLVQVATGLFGDDQEEFSGPLSAFLSNDSVRTVTRYHKQVGEPVLLVLVALHLGAIAWYCVRARRDLVGPMWHGDKRLSGDVPPSRDDARSRLLAFLAFGACLGIVLWIAGLGGPG